MSPERSASPADDAVSEESADDRESAWQRRRRLDAVFGDVLPSSTRDDRDDKPGGARDDSGDTWLRAQVPPHHG